MSSSVLLLFTFPQNFLARSTSASDSTSTSTSTSTSITTSASAVVISSPPPQKPPIPTTRARLSQLCKEGRLAVARRLFDSLFHRQPPPTIIWNTLLIGYVCNSLPDDALRLYALMNSSSGTPRSDAYTYSSALKACADTRNLRLGQSIHAHIMRHWAVLPPKNHVLNNSLLNMYSSSLDPDSLSLDVVRLLFDRMPKRNVVAWNTLISWYIRSRRPADALGHFKRMLEVGVRPTPVSFINAFPAVVECADWHGLCYALYSLLLKQGCEYVNDQFVTSAAISMFCELSDVQSARHVFCLAEEKNTQVWNTMIGGYIQNGQFDEALGLLVRIRESNVVAADMVTFLSSLTAVSHLHEVDLGRQIHGHLIKQYSLSFPVILHNALIVMYSRLGFIEIAFEVFCQMPGRDIVSWNTIISAFVQNDLNQECLLLVYEMQKEGFSVDSVAIMALLSAASNLGDLTIGREVHGYLIRSGIHCQGMESYLIDMYTKSSHVDTARKLFDGIPCNQRDQVTWNAMIAGYAQSGQTEEAMALFRTMLEEDQIPSSVTLASVLPACSPIWGIQAGKQIHGFAIRHTLDKNVFVTTALVDMYSKCGELYIAERVFMSAEQKNTVTYSTMLSGYGQHGFGEKALSLFKSMQQMGIRPDAITFIAILSACSYSGLVNEGLAVYLSMDQFGVVATPEHHCCIVDLLGRAARVEEAFDFVQGLGNDGRFIGIWGSLLAACKVHNKFEMGELVSKELFNMGKENGLTGYQVLLSNVYASWGNWENVDRVRKEIRERGLRKDPGSSWIGVGDISHQFMSKDQNHPDIEQIYLMVQELAFHMKSAGQATLEPCLLDVVSELN